MQPEHTQISDTKEGFARFDVVTFFDVFGDDHTAEWGP